MLTLTNKAVPVNPRNSNLELFRILMMLAIVAHHYVVNSGLLPVMAQKPNSCQSIGLYLFGMWGKTGINCFVLITGFFMCKLQISMKKLLRLIAEILFYSIIINLIFLITHKVSLSKELFFKSLNILADVNKNFVSAFLLYYCFIPFANTLVQNLSQKQHATLIILGLFIYSVLGKFPWVFIKMDYLVWFILLHFIASYICFYGIFKDDNTRLWGGISIGLALLAAFSVILQITKGRIWPYWFVMDSNAPLAISCAVAWFNFFRNVRIKQSRFINTVAAGTFGVLLIHANSDTMRVWLWEDLLNCSGQYGKPTLFLHAVLSVIIVFSVCNLIDFLRRRFIETPLFAKL